TVVKTLKNLTLREAFTEDGNFVGFMPSFECDWPRMERVLHNVMRGIFYTVNGRPVSQDMKFRVVHVDSAEVLETAQPLIETMGSWTGFGDDAFVCRYVFNDGPGGDYMSC